MTDVLVVNPGSSSLKLAMVDETGGGWRRTVDNWDGDVNPLRALAGTDRVAAVAVRVVHGGDRSGPVLLDQDELRGLEWYVPLAPLHQRIALRLAPELARLIPGKPIVGCFDTAFHTNLPPVRRLYPIRDDLGRRYGLVRHGFHGLSLAHAVRRTGELLDADPDALQMVIAHVGAGVSVTAVRDGSSVDTSMGFSPLDGVPGATRSGSLDPEILFHLLRTSDLTVERLESVLLRESGLAGMSGTDGDLRSVLRARAAGSLRAADAVAVYLHRIRQEIAAMRVSLDRLDALVLTGGVVEHQPALRAELLAGLGHLGVSAPAAADPVDNDAVLSTVDARVAVLCVLAREELEMARQARRLLGRNRSPL